MIFTDFSSNITLEAVKTSLNYIFNPLEWKKSFLGDKTSKFKKKLSDYFNVSNDSIFLLDSGRSCIYAALKAVDVKNKEVIVPGYTCSVVVNAIKWAGGQPVFIDIRDDFNLNVEKIKSKISKETKAVLVHHTFGVPAKMKKVKKICKNNKVSLIEDCAHSIGGKINKKNAGTFGDISIFSLGTNKVISSIRGGILYVNDKELKQEIEDKKIKSFPFKKIIKYLFYYPVFYLGRNTYDIQIGKGLLKFFQKINFLPKIIEEKEKSGKKPKWIPAKLPNFLSHLGLSQFKKLEQFNRHRKKINNIYSNNLPKKIVPEIIQKEKRIVNFKFPILVENPKEIHKKMYKKGFQLSLTWTGSNIVPEDFKPDSCYNNKCTKAKDIAENLLLLPTNINVNESEAQNLANNLVNLVKNSN